MDTFFTIKQASKGEYKENKSTFLAFAYPIENAEQVKQFVDNLKKEYYDARHHCFAYKIGIGKEVQSRAFDDREPSHTAGEKILGAIESKNLTNVLIVVVRYFGGIKLGASNLAKAYKQASMEALGNAEIIERTITEDILFSFDFSIMANVNKFLKDNRFDKTSYTYVSANEILLKVNKDNKENIINQLSSVFGIKIL
ncbi:MAG: YigZ family protein [Synergistales bacterium]|nr:YigZ family protein [Bacteroidales bacterium]MDY6435840.1 YigZ family protein [Synergistales bacterium]